jgi:hypothetical protein
MVKLIEDEDFKDKNCALRLINTELERGVRKIAPADDDSN